MPKNIKIIKGNIETSAQIMHQLPEFDSPYNIEEINNRINNVPHINLVAYVDKIPAGFKLGYEREGFFYSWLGGVLPKYRRMGIAKKLADEQEKWALKNNYSSIVFKTRNRHKAMLVFSIKNGFDIFKIDKKENIAEYRIWLRKSLRKPEFERMRKPEFESLRN